MNNNNKSTALIKQNQSFINKYNKKINDAKKLNSDEFYIKYGKKENDLKM